MSTSNVLILACFIFQGEEKACNFSHYLRFTQWYQIDLTGCWVLKPQQPRYGPGCYR